MKKQLYLYAILIIVFILYNTVLKVEDGRIDTIINIVFTSVLFLYIAYIAWVILKKMKNR
ncbi:hypothetical protein RIU07_07040 [Riemerella anatipestifer]|uniref:Uncharacterized protein n=1 Tax=Riemerella anatipestifer RA-CH-1 TaxID=1228997 RepID=J9R1V4_RIEAN|nr:hypothetical protein [Riemerella anatipestifer]AFR35749.1 hypothetical protein B739_1151 [Riemerella anatipestifer RA-CH-1]AIH02798.1 hypothetical protein M949_1631 [Riemerella anatipestifer CH3]MDD1548661.1 hypothetical protein [Riemerella anatipestifer]MDD1549988.1 hypothetical protein [Riemerella anatipestifer]MDD1552720.1 hypothetical protein [Riemerella anatipestifer]